MRLTGSGKDFSLQAGLAVFSQINWINTVNTTPQERMLAAINFPKLPLIVLCKESEIIVSFGA